MTFRFKRIWATSAVALTFAVVGVPSSAGAQQGGAAPAPQDSAAKDSVAKAVKDSVAKAKAAECAAANRALQTLMQKKAQEAQAQPKDSTKPKGNGQVSVSLQQSDLPPGITMQTLMRCMQGGAARRPAPAKPKPAAGNANQADTSRSDAKPADTTKTSKTSPSKD